MSSVAQALGARMDSVPEYNTFTNSDLQFQEWDGNPKTMASWLSDATYRIYTCGTSQTAAIRFAKLKLSAFLKNSMPASTLKTWAHFVAFIKREFYPVNWSIQVRLNLIRGIQLQSNNLRRYLNDFRAALAECPDVNEQTTQVLFLNGLETNSYLLYSVLHDWLGGWLEEMMNKAWRVYTGVIHPHIMQQVGKVPVGSSQWS